MNSIEAQKTNLVYNIVNQVLIDLKVNQLKLESEF